MPLPRTYQNDSYLKDIRRQLLFQANSAEEILWKFLRGKQLTFKFRRQFSIGNFVGDFYCHAVRLVIELDGSTHDSEKSKIKDERKQRFLESNGYRVLRISNEEVFGDIEILLNKIKDVCDATTPPSVPPLVGEGKRTANLKNL